MEKEGKLVILSSPSGGGKSTVCTMLKDKFPDVEYSISTTTRSPRKGEVDGKDYYFVEKYKFEELIKEDYFAEWAEVHGNYYGTSKKMINGLIKDGKYCLLDIDVQGGMSLKKKYPDALSIFILPPSFEELEKRLRKRETDNEDIIKVRLNNAKKEIEYKKFYDYVIVNNEIKVTVNKIVEILNKN